MASTDDRAALCAQIAAFERASLIAEARLTPKPGLVDAATNGAHTDMDFSTFLASITAITPYYCACAQVGMELETVDDTTLSRIRPLGIACEEVFIGGEMPDIYITAAGNISAAAIRTAAERALGIPLILSSKSALNAEKYCYFFRKTWPVCFFVFLLFSSCRSNSSCYIIFWLICALRRASSTFCCWHYWYFHTKLTTQFNDFYLE